MDNEEKRLIKGFMMSFWSCHNNDYCSAATRLLMQKLSYSHKDIEHVLDMNDYDDSVVWEEILEEIDYVSVDGGK